LKPGAEKLAFLFNYVPTVELDRIDLADGHREFHAKVVLHHRSSGAHVGDGVGSASTLEKKHRWRKAQRSCPRCKQETIIKGKEEYGGGWICWKSKGGCGESYSLDDPDIISQQIGNVENPDIADVYNTIKKMAKKRALIDAILTATGASSLFTQDVEDFAEPAREEPERREQEQEQASGNGGERNARQGRKATGPQIKMLKAKITAKAKSSDYTFDQIEQHLLNHFGIDGSQGLLMKDVDEAIRVIENIDRSEGDVPF
jgi:hypothetical protein